MWDLEECASFLILERWTHSWGQTAVFRRVGTHAQLLQQCPALWPCSLPESFVRGDSLGKNARVGCRALLQGVFLTQGSNRGLLRLLHRRQILYHWATEETHFPVYCCLFVHCLHPFNIQFLLSYLVYFSSSLFLPGFSFPFPVTTIFCPDYRFIFHAGLQLLCPAVLSPVLDFPHIFHPLCLELPSPPAQWSVTFVNCFHLVNCWMFFAAAYWA